MLALEIFSFAVVFVFLGDAASASENDYRIIGGRETTSKEVPYVARIEKFNIHRCGATIISRNFVVTTAHCLANKTVYEPHPLCMLRVRVASEYITTGDIYAVKKIILHENFTQQKLGNKADIALVQTERDFQFSDTVQLINILGRLPIDGEVAVVSGYGREEILRFNFPNRHLKSAEVPIVELSKCRVKLGINVSEDMICAGGLPEHQDSCTGDSGGPLTVEGQLVGIVAWGIGCGRESRPGVYTSVIYYKEWIEKTIKESGWTPLPEPTY